MLTFYHAPHSRAGTVHWMLEEIGAPYDMRVFNLAKGEQKDPAFLAVNPMGKVPALVHDGAVVTETAAIVTYLADAFPAAGLTVPIGDARRGPYLRWLFFGPGCMEPAFADRMMKREPPPPGQSGYGDFDGMVAVLVQALGKAPYLLGDQFTAADLMVGAAVNWGLMTEVLPGDPAILAYSERLTARPALRRAMARDADLAAAQR